MHRCSVDQYAVSAMSIKIGNYFILLHVRQNLKKNTDVLEFELVVSDRVDTNLSAAC